MSPNLFFLSRYTTISIFLNSPCATQSISIFIYFKIAIFKITMTITFVYGYKGLLLRAQIQFSRGSEREEARQIQS